MNVGKITFKTSQDASFIYSNNAFRCDPPTVTAVVNATNVVIYVTSFSEIIGDTPNAFNYGRSEYTYATFDARLSGSQIWSATDSRSSSYAFQNLSYTDPYMFHGTCDESAIVGGTISSMTNAPPSTTAWRQNMTTPDLSAVTKQAAGCSVASVVRRADGSFASVDETSQDDGFEKVFYATNTPWAVRQTTCGADFTDSCSLGQTYAFLPTSGVNGTVPCSLRTEAVLLLPTSEFMTQIASLTSSGNSASQTLVWTVSTVQVASASGVNATAGVNRFQWLINHFPFFMSINSAGAVVETLASGVMAPPLMISVLGSDFSSGGPSYQRLMADGRIRMMWQTHAFVQQPADYVSGNPAATVMGPMAALAPVWTAKPGFTATCSNWVAVADQQPLPAGEDSTISCAKPGCMPVSQINMPAELLFGFLNGNNPNIYWTEYFLKIVCYITPSATVDIFTDIAVPFTTVVVPYQLQSVGGGLLTDAQTPPFSQFTVLGSTLLGTSASNVSFATYSEIVSISDTLISEATTLTDLFVSPDTLAPVQGNVQYGQAFAFTVGFSDASTRAYWRLRPELVVMAAFDGGAPPASSGTLSPASPLDVDFCGLNSTGLVGVWAITDSSAMGTAPSEPDALVNAALWGGSGTYLNVSDSMTPALKVLMLELLANNTFSSIEDMQGDIMPEQYRGLRLATAVVPDGRGGFAVPARNRFFLGNRQSTLAGYSVVFCAITIAMPYNQLRVANTFPAYTTEAAALLDTGYVNGEVPAPIRALGVTLGAKDALQYFIPANPISTAGVICTDVALANVTTIVSTDPQCIRFFTNATTSRRRQRRLLSVAPLSVSLFALQQRPQRSGVMSTFPLTFDTSATQLDTRSATVDGSNGLDTGAIVGITIGAVLAAAAIALTIFFATWTRKKGAGGTLSEISNKPNRMKL